MYIKITVKSEIPNDLRTVYSIIVKYFRRYNVGRVDKQRAAPLDAHHIRHTLFEQIMLHTVILTIFICQVNN